MNFMRLWVGEHAADALRARDEAVGIAGGVVTPGKNVRAEEYADWKDYRDFDVEIVVIVPCAQTFVEDLEVLIAGAGAKSVRVIVAPGDEAA